MRYPVIVQGGAEDTGERVLSLHTEMCDKGGVTSVEEGRDVQRVTEMMRVASDVQSATVKGAMSAIVKLARKIAEFRRRLHRDRASWSRRHRGACLGVAHDALSCARRVKSLSQMSVATARCPNSSSATGPKAPRNVSWSSGRTRRRTRHCVMPGGAWRADRPCQGYDVSNGVLARENDEWTLFILGRSRHGVPPDDVFPRQCGASLPRARCSAVMKLAKESATNVTFGSPETWLLSGTAWCPTRTLLSGIQLLFELPRFFRLRVLDSAHSACPVLCGTLVSEIKKLQKLFYLFCVFLSVFFFLCFSFCFFPSVFFLLFFSFCVLPSVCLCLSVCVSFCVCVFLCVSFCVPSCDPSCLLVFLCSCLLVSISVSFSSSL